MKPVAIIPARLESKRLPGKLLKDLCGKPVIQRVYEQAEKAGVFSQILVATDSMKIMKCVESFGGKAVLTSDQHQCGTDRIAEVAETLEVDCIINIQGDEPFTHPSMLQEFWEAFQEESLAVMGTLKQSISSKEELLNPNVVKVVTDNEGYALCFSRSPIPYSDPERLTLKIDGGKMVWYKHIGIYAYKRDFLLKYTSLKKTSWEETERLEQLRALEHGYRIRVYKTQWETVGIDTREDLIDARNRWSIQEKQPLK